MCSKPLHELPGIELPPVALAARAASPQGPKTWPNLFHAGLVTPKPRLTNEQLPVPADIADRWRDSSRDNQLVARAQAVRPCWLRLFPDLLGMQSVRNALRTENSDDQRPDRSTTCWFANLIIALRRQCLRALSCTVGL